MKHLIWSHFGTSADQGPFWGSPGEVWKQIWNNIGKLKWRRCQKVPRTLCDDLDWFVVVLLSRCRCVAVEASLPAMRWSDDIDFAWIPWQETLEHNVPWPCLWVLLLRCCCVVVALLLRCCWRSPTGVRGFGDIFVIKLKKTSTSSTTLPHCAYGICCEICCWLVVDTLEASPTAMRWFQVTIVVVQIPFLRMFQVLALLLRTTRIAGLWLYLGESSKMGQSEHIT